MKIYNIDHLSSFYDDALQVYNDLWPNYPKDKEALIYHDTNYNKKYLFQRFVLVTKQEVVATGVVYEPWWSFIPGKLMFEINVLEDYQNQGLGTMCLNHVEMVLINHNGNKLNTYTTEDKVEGTRFLINRDFKIVLREPDSRLNVTNFGFSKFEPIIRKIKSVGIKIISLEELQDIDKYWKQNLYELYCKIARDVPNEDEYTERSFEDFEKQKLGAPGFKPQANFIALHKDQYIGLTSLWRQKISPKTLLAELTGVIRGYRRKGIASALKVHAAHYAKQCGAKFIETGNEENNPMFKINQSLGFVQLPAWVTFEKRY